MYPRSLLLFLWLLSGMIGISYAATPHEKIQQAQPHTSEPLTLSSLFTPVSQDKKRLGLSSASYTFKGAGDTIDYVRICNATYDAGSNTCTGCNSPILVITAGTPLSYSTMGTTYGVPSASVAAYLKGNGFVTGTYYIGMYVQSSGQSCSSSYCSTYLDTTTVLPKMLCMQATYDGAGNVTAFSQLDNGIAELNAPTSEFGYVADGSGSLWQCLINASGGITGGCTLLTTNQGFAGISSIAFNVFSGTTYAYIADGEEFIWQCAISTTGGYSSSCIQLAIPTFGTFVDATFYTFSGTTYIYVTDQSNDIYYCPMNATGGFSGPCTDFNPSLFSLSTSITFYTFGGTTYAYVTDRTDTIWKCPMNATGDFVGTCTALTNATSPGFNTTNGVTFKSFSGTTYAYVSDGSTTLWQCPLDIAGSFTSCTALTNSTSPGFNTTNGVTFNSFSGTNYAYVSDGSTTIWQCTLDIAGSFTSCTALTNSTSLGFNTTNAVTFYPFINLALVSAGQYQNTDTNYYPLLATSVNQGLSWNYTIDKTTPTRPSDYVDSGTFKSASCAGINCVAAGQYLATSFYYPLVATSPDSGATWSYTLDSTTTTLPADYQDNGIFNSVSCDGLNCVAAGSYLNNGTPNIQYPLLATSTNGGSTWTYTLNSATTPSVPTNYQTNGTFSGVSCTGSNCVAVGVYQSSLPGNPTVPMIALSTNGGASWAYITTTLLTDYKNVNYNGVSCEGLICVAVGYYHSIIANAEYPIAITSSDGGTTWTFTLDRTTTTLPTDYKTNGLFSSISCYGLVCSTAGQYENTSDVLYPLVGFSVDGGATWAYAIDSGTIPMDYLGNGIFNSISCSNNNCIAGGQYQSSGAGNLLYPFLVTTTNTGETWTYTLDSSSVPGDYSTGGIFNSVNCSGLNCVAAGQYQSTGGTFYPFAASSADGGSTWTYTIDSTTVPLNYSNNGVFSGVGSNAMSSLLSDNLRLLGDNDSQPSVLPIVQPTFAHHRPNVIE